MAKIGGGSFRIEASNVALKAYHSGRWTENDNQSYVHDSLLKTTIVKKLLNNVTMYTLYKVTVKLMYTLYNNLTIFAKIFVKSA